jgi:hypothetical protein
MARPELLALRECRFNGDGYGLNQCSRRLKRSPQRGDCDRRRRFDQLRCPERCASAPFNDVRPRPTRRR